MRGTKSEIWSLNQAKERQRERLNQIEYSLPRKTTLSQWEHFEKVASERLVAELEDRVNALEFRVSHGDAENKLYNQLRSAGFDHKKAVESIRIARREMP